MGDKEMNNLLTKETTKKEWLDQYHNYPSTLEEDMIHRPSVDNRILPIFYEIPIGAKVLDIGCNDGVFMEMLKDRRQCDVTGVEISDSMIEVCKKKGLNVLKTEGDILPFKDKSFDVITIMEVIIHVFDVDKFLSEIQRVLKPNGVVMGSSPHKNLESYIWDEQRLHRRYYDEIELVDELGKYFKKSYFKVLTGAQFDFGMAQSFIGDKKAEILFKCGGNKTKDWDEALADKSILRAWFGLTQTPGTAYYRMSGFCDKMQKMGAETFYEHYEETDFNSCADWQRKIRWKHVQQQFDAILRAADMSIWQITQSWDVLAFLMCIKDLFKKPIITEIDDWLFDIASYNMAANTYQPNSDYEKIAYKQIQISDYIICSTRFIKDSLQEMFPNKEITVIRNSIDFDIWDNIVPDTDFKKKEDGVIRIGYTGCSNHSGDVELIRKPIMALLDEFPNVEFVLPVPFESWAGIDHPRVLMSNKWVALSKYPSMIKGWNMDIGVAPLRDNNLNRAKSNLRWLEYGALRLPCVASSIYPFKNSINHGRDGIVVSNSEKSWYGALKDLILDKQKREKIGESAYKRIKKEYNMEDVSRKYLKVLKGIKYEFARTTSRIRPFII